SSYRCLITCIPLCPRARFGQVETRKVNRGFSGELTKMRLNMSLLIVGSLVFFLSACKKSPPTPAVAAGADWTMYGGTNDEQRGGGIRSRQSSRADLPVAVKDQRARGPEQQETDPPTGIDPPTGTATSGGLPSGTVGSSGRDSRNRERIGHARSPQPWGRPAQRQHRAGWRAPA